jgi:hypothetical protein
MTGNLAMVERWAEQFGPDELEQYVWGTGKETSRAIRSAISNEQLAIIRFFLDQNLHPGKRILAVIWRAYLEKRYSFLHSILGLSHIKPDISKQDEKSIHIWVTTLFKRHDDVPAQGLLEYLRSHGVNIQRTWMSDAAEHGCLDSLEYLIGAFEGDDLISACTGAMSMAARHGKRAVCKLLLDRGLWDPATSQKNDPMDEAAKNGEEEILHMILEGRQNLDDSQRWFRIAQLYHSARLGNVDAIKQLLGDTELPLDLRDHNFLHSTPTCCPARTPGSGLSVDRLRPKNKAQQHYRAVSRYWN